MDDIDSKELQTAVLVFAHYLGIDLDTEQELLSIAEEAFDQLPPGWEFGIGEGEHAGIPYFYNAATGQSEWKHPREELYMKKVKKEKQRIQDQRADKPKKAFDSPRANTNAKKEVEVVEVEDFDDSFESSKRPIDNKKTTTKAASSSPSKTKAQNNSGGFGMSSADFFDESGAENDRREDSKGAINSAGKSKSQSQSLPPMRDRYEGTNKHKDYDSSVASYSPRENYSDSDYVDDSRGRGTKTKKVNYQSSFGSRNSSAQNSADEAPLKSERSQSRAQSPTKNTVESKRPASAMGIGNRDWFAEPETTEKDLSRTFPPRKQEKDTKASERDYDRNNDRRYNYDDRRRRDEPGHLSIVSVADSRDEGDNFYETETDRRKYRDQDRDRDFDKSRNRDRDRDRDRNIGKDSRPRNPAWDDRGGRDSGVYTKQTQSRSLSPVKNDREVQDAIDSAVAVATEKLEVQHKREIQKCFDEIDQLKKDLEEQGDRNTSTSKRLNSEIATYKEDIRKLDEKLVSERADRRQILDKQDSMQADHLNRIRELEDAHEIKLREAVRRVKSDVEEDWKDRIQSIERRHNDEIDELKADVATTRRRLEEAQREADAARRKVNISRTDGKLEAQLETEGIKSGLRESEELNRQLSSEIKKLREDHASLTGKYAALQQICDVSVVEAEAAKARAASTIAEAQTNQAAFTQALQRIQQLDSDSAQLRAENMMLRREVENRSADLRKLETTTHISNDRTASVESESRRVKAQSQVY